MEVLGILQCAILIKNNKNGLQFHHQDLGFSLIP